MASGLQALQLNPENAQAHAFMSEVYLDLELIERARTAAERAIELDPDSPVAYYASAEIRRYADFDIEGARADYQTAYELGPYYTDAAVEKAWMDFRLEQIDEAINTLNEVKDANPDNTSVLYALGYMYWIGLGDPNPAADQFARCVNVDTTSDLCHYSYGRVLISLEQYTDAADELARAVELTTQSDTPNSRYHYWAAEAQIYMGDCTSALNFLRPGLDIARAQNNEELTTALQTSITECSAFDGGFDIATPTPDAVPTIEPDV
ncbi:MAG: tetratricopeptide repeat protein, partial [Chloroflexota bacterium]